MTTPWCRAMKTPRPDLFEQPVKVINLGLEVFAENLRAEGIDVIQVDWRPPAGGDPHLARLLAALDD